MLCSWNPEHPRVNLTGNGRHLALERWGKRGEKNRARRQITETETLKKIHFSLHGITWYQHKPLPLSPSPPFPQQRHCFSEIKIMDLWRRMANNSTSLQFRGWTLLLKTVLLRWWSIVTVPPIQGEHKQPLFIVGKSAFCSQLAAGVWLWKDESKKAEEVDFCVVGHFQFT